jgi:protein-tyrosine phosphatase
MTLKPIKNCYWVVSGKLLAGEYPRNKDEVSSPDKINSLLSAGITAFIDLTHENDRLLPYHGLMGNISHHRFPIRDGSIPENKALTDTILDTIDSCISQRQLVYVHCWGGSGRTGLIVGCWLVRHGLAGTAALDRLKELWQQCPKSQNKGSPDNKEQEQYILNWRHGR